MGYEGFILSQVIHGTTQQQNEQSTNGVFQLISIPYSFSYPDLSKQHWLHMQMLPNIQQLPLLCLPSSLWIDSLLVFVVMSLFTSTQSFNSKSRELQCPKKQMGLLDTCPKYMQQNIVIHIYTTGTQ